MKFELDEYADLDSPVHRWEPRYKLIGLTALIFSFAFVEKLSLLPPMLTVTAILYWLSGLPFSFWLKRLRYPGFFLLGVIVLLPFLSGEIVVWQWGWLTLRQEGLLAVVLIAARFLAIITTGFILLGTTPFLTTIKAMRSLGLPSIFADMVLLTYRYLSETAETLTTMQQAMRLRGFRLRRRSRLPFIPKLSNLQLLSSLAGTLLIRSYEQSERVYKAMRLRGYGNEISQSQDAAFTVYRRGSVDHALSAIALFLTLCIAAGFVVAEFL